MVLILIISWSIVKVNLLMIAKGLGIMIIARLI